MKKIIITEEQAKIIANNVNEDKKITRNWHKAQGHSKVTPMYNYSYDTGDNYKKTNLNDFFKTNGKQGMEDLKRFNALLKDVDNNEYDYLGYTILGNKGIKVNVKDTKTGEQRTFFGSNISVEL